MAHYQTSQWLTIIALLPGEHVHCVILTLNYASPWQSKQKGKETDREAPFGTGALWRIWLDLLPCDVYVPAGLLGWVRFVGNVFVGGH